MINQAPRTKRTPLLFRRDMSSKHLLDLLILASSAQAVLRQHIRLQAHQIGLYTQTSSIIELLRGGINRKAGTVGNSTEAPRHEVTVDIGRRARAGVEKPLDTGEETQGQVTAVIGELETDKSVEQKAEKYSKVVELEKRLNTTFSDSAPIPERQPQPPLLSASRTDPDLFILRSARGLSPLLSRMQKPKEEDETQKLQLGNQKERDNAQRPLKLHSIMSLSAIATPPPLAEPPSTAVRQETQVIVKEHAASELKMRTAKETINPPHPDEATNVTASTTPFYTRNPLYTSSTSSARATPEISTISPPLPSPTSSNNSPTSAIGGTLTSCKSTTEKVHPLHK